MTKEYAFVDAKYGVHLTKNLVQFGKDKRIAKEILDDLISGKLDMYCGWKYVRPMPPSELDILRERVNELEEINMNFKLSLLTMNKRIEELVKALSFGYKLL